jgi:hypothetical protein
MTKLLLVLVAGAALMMLSGSASADDHVARGDVNCDGSLTAQDTLTVLAFSAGARSAAVPGCDFVINQRVDGQQWSDFDCDEAITGLDALILLQHFSDEQPAGTTPIDDCSAIGDQETTAPDHIACDMLNAASYRYEGHASLIIGANDPAGTFLTDITGQVEAGRNIQESVTTTWDNLSGHSEHIQVGDSQFFSWGNGIWDDISSRPPVIPYLPAVLCDAIAADITSEMLTGPEEDVNGIPSVHVHFADLVSQFAARTPDFSGDPRQYITTFTGDIWVARGGYITKLSVAGAGEYPDHTPISISASYEISDLHAVGIVVDPPL